MDFEIKNLSLFRDLVYTTDEENSIMKTEDLTVYRNCVDRNDMNPDRNSFLTEGKWIGWGLVPETELLPGKTPAGIIPAGNYLFVQFFMNTDDETQKNAILAAGAEAVHLEALWQDTRLTDQVYVRTLQEGGRKVYQIFRMIDEKPE